jgi:hypothetical protein
VWNEYVFNTWIDMAESVGVVYLPFFEGVADTDMKALEAATQRFSKAAASAGVTYQDAIHEAQIRKRMEEKGIGREAAEREVAEKAATKKVSKKAAASKTAEVADESEEGIITSMKEAGVIPKVIGGVKYWLEEDSAKLYLYGEGGDFGELAGVYDPDADAILEAE